MMKRVLLLFFALLTIVGRVSAQEEYAWVDGVYYNFLPWDRIAYVYEPPQNDSWNIHGEAQVVVPDSVTYDNVTYVVAGILGRAFAGNYYLQEITIGANVWSVSETAFKNCNYINVVHFNARHCILMRNEDVSVFYDSRTRLKTIDIGSDVTMIPAYAFAGLSATKLNITFPDSLKMIYGYAFYQNNFEGDLIIPSTIDTIGEYAFANTKVRDKVIIDAPDIKLGYSCFDNSSMRTLSVNVRDLPGFYFNKSISNELTIGPCVQNLGAGAFYGNGSKVVYFNATNLSHCEREPIFGNQSCGMSYDHSKLETIIVGSNVTKIPDYFFYSCVGVRDIVCGANTPPTIYSHTFDYLIPTRINLTVRPNRVPYYRDASYWKKFTFTAPFTLGGQERSFDIGQTYDLSNDSHVLGGSVSYFIGSSFENGGILTLRDATIDCDSVSAIVSRIGLKIVLYGNNTINSSQGKGIETWSGVQITGPGNLTIRSHLYGIDAHSSSVIIDNCNLEVESDRVQDGSVYTKSIRAGYVVFNDADVVLDPHNTIPLWAQGVVYNGCALTSPLNVVYGPDCYDYVNSIASYNGRLVISADTYDLEVKGVQVTTHNKDRIAVSDEGQVLASYDPATNELSLFGNINVSSSSAIKNGIPNLKIKSYVDNATITISSTDNSYNTCGIYSTKPFTIEGPNNYLISGDNGIITRGSITLYQTNVICNGARHSIFNSDLPEDPDNADTLFVIVSDLYAHTEDPANYAAILFGELSMTSVDIKLPEGGRWIPYYNTVVGPNGNNRAGDVSIGWRYYGLFVSDYAVTSANCHDIFRDGTASYDEATKTLTLNNLRLNTNTNSFIKNNINGGFTVNLVGDNHVWTNSNQAIFTTEDITFTGTGSLDIENSYTGLYAAHSNVTVTGGCHLSINGSGTMIHGDSGNTLTIDDSEVSLFNRHPNGETLLKFGNLALTDCTIATDGAYWNSELGKVVDENGDSYYGSLDIGHGYYQLYVAGTQVSMLNADDVLGDGKVRFDASTSTLMLHNAYIYTDEYGIYNAGIPELTILAEGNNQIHSNITDAIYTTKQIYFKGAYHDATMIVSGLTAGIRADKSVNVEHLTMYVYGDARDGTSSAFVGQSDRHLHISDSHVFARNTYSPAAPTIRGFGSFYCTGCGVTNLPGYAYNATTLQTEVNGSPYSGNIEIAPYSIQIWVKGQQVTTMNAFDVLNDGGSIRFDDNSRVLTLNNAELLCNTDHVIRIECSGVTIKLEGYNELYQGHTENSGIYAKFDLVIDGPGTMIVQAFKPIYLNGTNLTIQGQAVVNLSGIGGTSSDYNYCIYSPYTGRPVALTIDRSTLDLYSHDTYGACLWGITNFNLVYSRIVQPQYYTIYWNEEQQNLYGSYGVGLIRGHVKIEPAPVGLTVADTELTWSNGSDLFGDGTVSYDYEQNILTLNNFTAPDNINYGILNYVPNLTVKLIGVNSIPNAGSYGIQTVNADMVIEGPGTLNVYGSWCIEADYSNLTIQNQCVLNLDYDPRTIPNATIYSFDDDDDHTLTISCSTVRATSHDDGYYEGFGAIKFGHIVLDGVQITQPEGAEIVTIGSSQMIYKNDRPCYETVTISVIPYDIWVAGVRVDAVNAHDVLGDGHVSYDVETNTLTLDNANIHSSVWNVIGLLYEGANDLYVQLIGSNVIDMAGNGIEVGGDNISLILRGPGSLSVTGDVGLYSDYSYIYLEEGCNVTVTGIWETIDVQGMVITDSRLLANPSSNHVATFYAHDMTTYGCDIIHPSNAYWDSQSGLVKVGTQAVTDAVLIEGVPYDLHVAGHVVTRANRRDVLGDGTVSYDPETNVLTLNGALLSYPNAPYLSGVIQNYIRNLVINLVGDNTINCYRDTGILSSTSLKITGQGSLTISYPETYIEEWCIDVQDDLDIMGGCQIYLYGEKYLLHADVLRIRNSMVSVSRRGTTGLATLDYRKLFLTGSSIVTPGAIWDGNAFSPIVDPNGNTYIGDILIIPTYGLKVAGIQVTQNNASDILNDGTVSYDPVTNVLRLQNASINSTNDFGIENSIENLTIELIGDNRVASVNSHGIKTDADLTISGTGNLNVVTSLNNNYSPLIGIWANMCNLTIEGGCVVTVNSSLTNGVGIYGEDMSSLTVNASTLNVQAECLIAIGELTMVACNVISPHDADWNPYCQRIWNQDGEVHGQATIGYERYGVYINGIQVTALNASNITGVGISGSVSYDRESLTLTLDNADIYSDGAECIRIEDDTRLLLIGENHLSRNDMNVCVNLIADMIIDGRGSLYVDANQCILSDGMNLTIQGGSEVVVTSYGTTSATYPIRSTGVGILTINGSYLYAESRYEAAPVISGFANMILSNCMIVEPEGAYYDDYFEDLEVNSVAVKDYVEISGVEYDLWIAGTRVNSANAVDFFADGGSVVYNHETNTLTLHNANINISSNYAVQTKLPALNIELIGEENYIYTTYEAGIYSESDELTFTGTGYLRVEGSDNGILCVAGDITFEGGCQVDVHSNGNQASLKGGFLDYVPGTQSITVENSTLRVIGNHVPPIQGFTDLNLSGSIIEAPAGGVWGYDDDYAYCVQYVDGDPVTSMVAIAPNFDLWVGNTKVTTSNANHITDSSITSGSVSYNYGTKVLTLDHVIMNNTSGNNANGITNNNVEGLTILVKGLNQIQANHYGLSLSASTNIECVTYQNGSSSSLNSIATGYALYGTAPVTVHQGSFILQGTSKSIYLTNTLTLDSVSFTSYCANPYNTNMHVNNLELIDTYLSEPIGAVWNNVTGNMEDGNGNVITKGNIRIKPAYKLWVAGIQVTPQNRFDILGDGGSVVFDGQSNLTLHDATVINADGNGIQSDLVDLFITLEGDNTVIGSGQGSNGIQVISDMSITGTGSLAASGTYYGIKTSADMTIQDAGSVVATGQYGGIYNSTSYILTIKNSSVAAVSTMEGSPIRFRAIVLDHCAITTPGVVWNAPMMYRNNEVYTGRVDIAPAYDLWVGGVQVTDVNASNILGNGSVSYDPTTNVLHLENANINNPAQDGVGISSAMEDLTIEVYGTNTVYAHYYAIRASENLTITGPGVLEINNSTLAGIYTTSNLTIEGGCCVIAEVQQFGVYGNNDKTLTISNASLITNSLASYSQNNPNLVFGSLILDGCSILTPDVQWNPSEHCVYTMNGHMYTGKVEIGMGYELWVKDVQVMSINARDILGDGKVCYNAVDNTLTLRGAQLSWSYSAVIYTHIDGLTIALEGSNSIVNTGTYGIHATKDLIIDGRGSLTVTVARYGIFTAGTLTIQGGCYVSATSTQSGNAVSGKISYPDNILTVRNSTLVANVSNNQDASIYGYNILVLEGCSITEPVGGTYHNLRMYDSDNQPYLGQVTISPEMYQLWVDGLQVTSANAPDVLRDGTVSYDAENNVLNLTNATISSNYDMGIQNKISNLRINLVGENQVSSYFSGIQSQNANFVIEGDGELNITAGQDGILAQNCDVTIQGGCTLHAVSQDYSSHCGISGSSANSLTISGSTVTAYNTYGLGGIKGFGSMNIENCTMITPQGGYYDTDDREIVDSNGDTYTGEVVISTVAFDLWVAGVQVTSGNASNIQAEGLTGTVSYDYATHTLQFTNAEISMSRDQFAIRNEMEGTLNMNFVGANTINAVSGIYTNSDVDMLLSGGSLDIVAQKTGIRMSNSDLNIDGGSLNITVTGNSTSYMGIWGSPSNSLTVSNSTVSVESPSTRGSIYGFEELNTEGITTIALPRKAYWDGEDGKLKYEDNGSVATGRVLIEPSYGVFVGNHGVSPSNADDVFGDGTISYDDVTSTLTLNNATIDTYHPGIKFNYEPLKTFTLELIGENNVTGHYGILMTSDNLIIEGQGVLNVTGTAIAGIDLRGHDLTIQDGCIVNAIGGESYSGILGRSGVLTVDNATLTAASSGTSVQSIYIIDNLVLTGCSILAPQGAVWDAVDKKLETANGDPVTERVVIGQAYNLWVANVQVTDANAGDVLGDGKVSYNPLTNVLSLNQATITTTASSVNGINNNIANLTIYLEGDNTVSVTGSSSKGIQSEVDIIIEGPGSLNVSSQRSSTIYVYGDLTIRGGCTVNAYTSMANSFSAIFGHSTNTLTIDNATVIADAPNANISSIYNFNTLTLTGGCSILYPEGVYYSNRRVNDQQGNMYKGRIVIGPKTYNLLVAGVEVTEANKDDILGDGTVSYDPVREVLTLNNAHITYNSDDNSSAAIYVNGVSDELETIVELDIQLIGSNTIQSNCDGINVGGFGYYSILGPGSLQITAVNGILDNSSMANWSISSVCNITINATHGGIDCWDLNVTNSQMSITGATGSLYVENEAAFIGCDITQPEPYHWLQSGYLAEYGSNAAYTGEVIISPDAYNLWVAGTQVTTANVYDVLGDGKVSYNPSANTLTLNNAVISTTEFRGIYNEISNLKIALVGTNTISTSSDNCITSTQDFSIEGTGMLQVTCSNTHAIFAYNNLTISGGCTVNATSNASGGYVAIICHSGKTLTVNNSNVVANAPNSTLSSIYGFGALSLIGDMSILEPAGAYYSNRRVYDQQGNMYIGRVVIGPVVNYDIWVAGVQVTNVNANDVLGDGHVWFNPMTNTLTFSDANMVNGDDLGLRFEIPNLTLELIGENYLDPTDDGYGIYSDEGKNFTITGTGILHIDNDVRVNKGIVLEQCCNLNITSGCTVLINAYQCAVYSYGPITVDNARLVAATYGDDAGRYPIFAAGGLVMVGCVITEPVGAEWDNDYYCVLLNGQEVRDRVVIEPVEYYDLWVAGVQVSSAIASDVLGDGKVSYNASTNTLTLNNAAISTSSKRGIDNAISNLKIALVGTNTISTASRNGIISTQDFSIEGTGTLQVTSSNSIAIYASSCNLTISGGCTVNATTNASGDYVAINGISSKTLTVNNSNVVANAPNSTLSSIYGFGALSLIGDIGITEPAGAYYSNGRINDQQGNMYIGRVVIGPGEPYDLMVAGTQVTTVNASDVLGDGKVSYNASTNTLTLNNAAISITSTRGIDNAISNLKIALVGTNTISTSSRNGIISTQDFSIEGTGTLQVTSSNTQAINASDCNLAIRGGCMVNATTNASGSNGAIIGSSGKTLTVNNSNVVTNAPNSTLSSIYGFSTLNYVNCGLIEPLKGRWNSSNRRMYSNNLPYLGEIRISNESYHISIGNTAVTAANAANVLGNGHVWFNPMTNTLTFSDAHIVNGYYLGLFVNRPNVTLELIGESYLDPTDDGIGIYVDHSAENFTITGTGILHIDNCDLVSTGIIVTDGNLNITGGCTVMVTASMTAVGCKGTLTVDNAGLVAATCGIDNWHWRHSIYAEGGLVTVGCDIAEPVGAEWDNNNHCVVLNGQEVKDRVVIGCVKYNLKIGDTYITACNANDVFGDGTVSFDESTSTLTLNNAQIEEIDARNYYKYLTIQLQGDNTINVPSEWIGLTLSESSGQILGPGSLVIRAEGRAIYSYGDLYISNCFVDGYADEMGFQIEGELEIANAVVMASCMEDIGSLATSHLILTGTEITQPVGAEWNDGYVEDGNGNVVNTLVVIEPYACVFIGSQSSQLWSNPINWQNGAMPTRYSKAYVRNMANMNENVVIRNIVLEEDGYLNVNNGVVLEADSITNTTASKLMIWEGGQLIVHKAGTVAQVYNDYTAWGEGTGWRLISSPVVSGYFSSVGNFANANYDLYRYNETNHNRQEWENYKLSYNMTCEPGRGYLYASQTTTQKSFHGELNYAPVHVTVTYTEPHNGYPIAGYNLIGNPFTHNIYKGSGAAIDNPHLAAGYYTLNSDGEWVEQSDATPIAPMQAILVRTDATTELTINNTTAASKCAPVVVTGTVTVLTTESVTCGAEVTSDGNVGVDERGVCWSTSPNPTIADNKVANGSGTGSFNTVITNLASGTTYYVRAYATNSMGTSYGAEVSFSIPKWYNGGVEGALPGQFTINNSNDKVYFSQGNLQYIGSAETPYWTFAENQWDVLGDHGQGSSDQNVDRDLFGWGAGGYHDSNDPYNTQYQPWSTSQYMGNVTYNEHGYGPSINMSSPNLTGTSANYDWGVYNPISNGGNEAGLWHTLTNAEWNYLINLRSTESGYLFVKAQVNGTNGVILLPDNWNTSLYTLNNRNSSGAAFTSNVIDLTSWQTILESNGAVFLPAAGYRSGTSVSSVDSRGRYWSSSYSNETSASALNTGNTACSTGEYGRYFGFAVRLVHTAE